MLTPLLLGGDRTSNGGPIGQSAARIDSSRLGLPRMDMNHPALDALLEENKQLRELIVQLSEIVVRNVLDRPLLPPRLVEG
jgi:hypothetical protein